MLPLFTLGAHALLVGSLLAPSPDSDGLPNAWRPLAGQILLSSREPDARLVDALRQLAGGEPAHLIVIGTHEGFEASPHGLRPLSLGTLLRLTHQDQAAIGLLLLEAPADASDSTRLRKVLAAVLDRGGVVAAAGSAIEALGADGLGLLPNAEIGSGSGGQPSRTNRFRIGLGDDASLLLRGRRGDILSGEVEIAVGEGPGRPVRRERLAAGHPFDWIAWSRAAAWRSRDRFTPIEPRPARVDAGALVIVGGGLTDEIAEEFITLAGGADETRLVIVPTAIGEPAASRSGHDRSFRGRATEIRVVHANGPDDPRWSELIEALAWGNALWFTGGRQWRLVDAYAGTEAEQQMHALLARGGVIGGSSAGASIQAQYLVRGNPLGNREMMSEGYERGFGFLPGVAIDQHFTQRNRLADLESVKQRYPELIGLGIDERTAIIVQGSTLRVVGAHRVAVYAETDPETGARPTFLEAGQRYDLVERAVVQDG